MPTPIFYNDYPGNGAVVSRQKYNYKTKQTAKCEPGGDRRGLVNSVDAGQEKWGEIKKRQRYLRLHQQSPINGSFHTEFIIPISVRISVRLHLTFLFDHSSSSTGQLAFDPVPCFLITV